jgi:hypothetical protein
MKNACLIVFSLLLIILTSCKEYNKSIYEGCCGTESITDSIPMTVKLWNDQGLLVDSHVVASVSIPNVFTPDSVYYEDHIFLMCGIYVVKVVTAKYTSESGETLFENGNFQVYDTGPAWHGQKPNGEYYYGSFDYEITLEFWNGTLKTYTGRACSFKCGAEGFPTEKLPNCFFPSQNDGFGGIDTSRPYPIECF